MTPFVFGSYKKRKGLNPKIQGKYEWQDPAWKGFMESRRAKGLGPFVQSSKIRESFNSEAVRKSGATQKTLLGF